MSATISLIALRFEIASVTNNASFLNFSAQQYKEQKTTTDSTFTYASVLSSEDRKKEDIDVIRECRGSRKHQEFIVESYYNEYLGRETDVDNPENMPNKHKAKKTSEKSAPPEERYVLSKDKQIAGGDDFHPISPSPAPVHRPKSIIDEPGPSPSPAVGQEDSQKRLSGSSGRHKSQSPSLPSNIHFYYGNPMVERIEGILHLYKENKMTPLKGDQPRSELICMLAVPGMYSIHDLLKFTAPVNEAVEYMRIIRDGTPNQFMALIKFKSQESADEFYCTYNNVQFNSIEPDICSLAYVAKVETEKETEGANLPVPGFTELPCCPVCLEKMDESVEGVLTILCNHSFHMSCLSKWGDTSCPVCRYIQTPEDVSESRCMKCGSSESLWICLICGHIGCGRYVELHAYRHFQDTNHMYAMQLGQNRVWDYVGDNYVHRLVQSKGDGKLVQVGENQSEGQEEKIDSLNLEYTYLLTSQLESQRHYFEEKVKLVEQAAQEKVDEILSKNEDKVQEMSSICERLESVIKEKSQLEKKCAHLHSRLTKALTELQEEKDINACMRKNQESWQKKTDLLIEYNDKLRSDKNKEIEDLREQVRDVMFYLEAAKQLSNNTEVPQAEIQESQVVLGATGSTPSPSHRRGKKKEK